MSPIPSVVTAFAFTPAAPSVTLDPDSVGQSASAMSQHLIGTGGFVFAVVALVSLAGYFYHGRASTTGSRTNNAWAALSGLLSSICHRGSATTSTAAPTKWPVDLEVGIEHHVNMVYARHFHPTFWNVVECHPATPSAPAIYVEEEANEIPVRDPTPPGMNSFLDMDDHDGDGDDTAKHACKKPDRKELPPFDTSLPTIANFSSEIIGTTVRPGAFLFVPGELEDDSSESSPPGDSELDFDCSPYDGIVITDFESDFSYDGIVTPPRRSSTDTRRYGVADTAYFSQSLGNTIPEEGYDLVPTISPPTGLFDFSKFVDTDPTLSCGSLYRLGPVDDESAISNCDICVHDGPYLPQNIRDAIPEEGYGLVPTISPPTRLFDPSNFVYADSTLSCGPLDRVGPMVDQPTTLDCDISVHDDRDGSSASLSDPDTVIAPPHEGLDLMRKLLAELRDPTLDCTPRPFSEDGDSEYYDTDDEMDEILPFYTPPSLVRNVRRNSLESTSTSGADSDASDEGPIYPLTPPSAHATPLSSALDVCQDPSSFVIRFNQEVLVMSPTSFDPPALPTKAYVCSHRDSRSLYGPRVPLGRLPRL